MINIGINTNLLIYKTTDMNISFNLKGVKTIKKLYVRMHYGKLDLLVSTNLMLMESQWNSDTQTAVNDNDINIGLSGLKLAILKQFNKDYVLGTAITKLWLENVIKTSFMRPKAEVSLVNPAHTLFVTDFSRNWIQNHADSWKVSANKKMGKTLKGQYLKFIETLEEYEKLIGEKWQLRSLSVNDINGFVQYLETENYQNSTIKRNVGRLKFFLLRAEENNLEVSSAFKQRIYFEKEEEIDGVYLNETEIAKIYNLDLNHDEMMDNVRDNLMISVWTGLRISDFMHNLKLENIKDGLISIKTKKTGSFVKIPTHPNVKSILKKRFGNLPQKIASDEYNKQLKVVCQLAEIDNMVYGKLFNPKTKRKEVGYHKKFLLCASHIGRKSLISNLKGKVSDELLMNIGGWTTKTMVEHYSKITKTEYAKELSNYWGNN